MINPKVAVWKKATTTTKEKLMNIQAIIVLIIFVVLYCTVGYIESHYTKKAIVIEVINNCVTVEDERGSLWAFERDENEFHKGDIVKLTISTNHTDYIYDDFVIKAKIIY